MTDVAAQVAAVLESTIQSSDKEIANIEAQFSQLMAERDALVATRNEARDLLDHHREGAKVA